MNETNIAPATKPPDVQLTTEQQHGIDLIATWLKDKTKPEFKLGGYAGTGKTTLMKAVCKAFGEDLRIDVCAPTGKASHVLQRKGVNADTIHSTIYDCINDGKGKFHFELRRAKDLEAELYIVDESSMVSTDIYKDLKSFNRKYLWVGDPGQLEPVGENPNLMAEPDYVLKQIHRQAQDNPIIKLANEVRTGGTVQGHDGERLVIRDKNIKASDGQSVDQIICATNKNRTKMNTVMRQYKGLRGPLVEGEKIIVLKNNRDMGLVNGLILFIKSINADNSDHWECNCVDEIGKEYTELAIWKVPFTDPTFNGKDAIVPRLADRTQLIMATYGYCITCHKSQGSEWKSVLVFDEQMPPNIWDMKRWRYTAITRAAEKLIYCI